jgi:hypothetical protein
LVCNQFILEKVIGKEQVLFHNNMANVAQPKHGDAPPAVRSFSRSVKWCSTGYTGLVRENLKSFWRYATSFIYTKN